jgi:catechol 2,3-dioxygenase-like lactoylglutathione lyase family enzyme
MELGWCDVCLRVSSATASVVFYQKLGFHVVEGGGEGWAVVTNGDLRLGLFEHQFMDDSTVTLNFRGGDVFAIAEELKAKELTFSKGPVRGASGGCSGTLLDPDGYQLFFDTAPGETKKV